MIGNNTLDWLIIAIQDFLLFLRNCYGGSRNKQPASPSLMANNIIWFTNSTWLDRLISFQQLDTVLYKNKHYHK